MLNFFVISAVTLFACYCCFKLGVYYERGKNLEKTLRSAEESFNEVCMARNSLNDPAVVGELREKYSRR